MIGSYSEVSGKLGNKDNLSPKFSLQTLPKRLTQNLIWLIYYFLQKIKFSIDKLFFYRTFTS